jgi:hypothetical protein
MIRNKGTGKHTGSSMVCGAGWWLGYGISRVETRRAQDCGTGGDAMR